ncbi:YihY/virulence factor BrkB family protein [Frankia sp. AgB32]|uniref:YihY/virulence factor BrkB family protein n=1 Tax=Frankia sp. AgB32 TaxID=631119 RepID=UPI00200D4A8B|nr:YihY/virulence factor BrkB family protein [Frankia sp. AgB32]MCK9897923.1 YihY/virulence factor BrkB family protein [Frankia sp. AgB32]
MNPSALLGRRHAMTNGPAPGDDGTPDSDARDSDARDSDARDTGAHDRARHETSRPVRDVEPPRRGPTSVTGAGWLAVGKRVKSQVGMLSIPLLASGVAFWAVLSIFPAVIAVITVYGLVASPKSVSDQISKLSGSLSPSTSTVLRDWLTGITTTNPSGLGIGLLLSLVGLLWAVSSGTQNLIKAVTIAFEQEETRGPLRLRALAVAMSLGGVVVAVLVIGGITAGDALLSHVPGGGLRTLLMVVQWLVLALVLLGAITALYRLGPAHTPANWRWASLGAVVATVALIVASLAFSFYVRSFSHYNKTYGALGGVVVLMLWLYYAVTVVLVGALLDAEAAREATGATRAETYPESSPVDVRQPWDRPDVAARDSSARDNAARDSAAEANPNTDQRTTSGAGQPGTSTTTAAAGREPARASLSERISSTLRAKLHNRHG